MSTGHNPEYCFDCDDYVVNTDCGGFEGHQERYREHEDERSDHDRGACWGPGCCDECNAVPEGFEEDCLDRLLEPYSDEELGAALERRRLRREGT